MAEYQVISEGRRCVTREVGYHDIAAILYKIGTRVETEEKQEHLQHPVDDVFFGESSFAHLQILELLMEIGRCRLCLRHPASDVLFPENEIRDVRRIQHPTRNVKAFYNN